MRDLRLESECEKFSLLHLCKNNHTCIYAHGKWDSDKALEILEMLKYCDASNASNNKGARKKFFVTTFENFQNVIYTVYTAIPR